MFCHLLLFAFVALCRLAIQRLQADRRKARSTTSPMFTRVARNRAYPDICRQEAERWNDGTQIPKPFGSKDVVTSDRKLQAATRRHNAGKATGVRQDAGVRAPKVDASA